MTSDTSPSHGHDSALDAEMSAAAQRLVTFAAKPYIKENHEGQSRILQEETQALSLLTGSPLRTIVSTLAETSFLQFQLLPDEFAANFRNQALAHSIVKNFARNITSKYQKRPPNATDDPDYEKMRALLFSHADAYSSTSERTLDRVIAEQAALYPNVNFGQIVSDSSFQLALVERIEQAAISIISPAYHALFENNAEKFILEFLFYRVFHIDTDTGVVRVKDAPLRSLIGFLHQEDYPLENIYLALYRHYSLMQCVPNIHQDVRAQVERTTPALLRTRDGDESETPFFDPNFNFDAFWKSEFEPVICDIRKPSGRKTFRMVDFLEHPLSVAIRPEQMCNPFKELASGFRFAPDLFERFARLEFSYPPSVSFELIKRELANQLEATSKQFDYTREHAFSRRPDDDSIHQDCKYIPEILSCRNVQDIITWIAYPEQFFEKNPDYQDVISPDVVRFEALRFYQLFLFCREHLFKSRIQDIPYHRDLLEKHLREVFSISETVSHVVSYRVGMRLNPATQTPLMDQDGLHQYDVFFNKEDSSFVPHDQEGVYSRDDQMWHLFPYEDANLTLAEVSIPRTNGEPVRGYVQFYTGDGHLLHGKKPESIVSAMLRGKEPTDYVRFSLVTELAEMEQALKDYFYHKATGGANKIDDAEEERSIRQMAQSKVRGAGSNVYRSERPYDAAHHILIPVVDEGPDGQDQISYAQVLFEVQILNFRKMLAAVSDYTVTSHGRVYVPEREFRTWFSTFMPPVVFGSRYADYQLSGFDGKKV